MNVSRAIALGLLLIGLASCGETDRGDSKPRLTVAAATSLKTAFTAYGERFGAATARFSFAGSDELAAQLRQGVRPDVYATADAELARALFREGRLERPRVFAGNRLVIAVRTGSGIASLSDLERPGTDIAMGSEGVPVGRYARRALRRLPVARARAILANVRSNEPDVAGVVGKLTQGAADAGFVYASDVRAGEALRAIELPRRLSPRVRYAIAVVRGARRPLEARRFIDGLRAGAGARVLRRAGFEPSPVG